MRHSAQTMEERNKIWLAISDISEDQFDLNSIYDTYKDQAKFLCVYVREAHPDDGWRVPENLEANIHEREPTTDKERTEVAHVCQLAMDLKIPMLIDDMDNSTEEHYKSMPMRLYLVNRDGLIAYTGDQGPFGFDPDSWEAAIKEAAN